MRDAILKKLKILGYLLLAYVLVGIVMVIYSNVWMTPRANSSKDQFEKLVITGSTIAEIRKIANDLRADSIRINDVQPPENEISKRMSVLFYSFPTGLSRNACTIYLVKDRAVLVSCKYID